MDQVVTVPVTHAPYTPYSIASNLGTQVPKYLLYVPKSDRGVEALGSCESNYCQNLQCLALQ